MTHNYDIPENNNPAAKEATTLRGRIQEHRTGLVLTAAGLILTAGAHATPQIHESVTGNAPGNEEQLNLNPLSWPDAVVHNGINEVHEQIDNVQERSDQEQR